MAIKVADFPILDQLLGAEGDKLKTAFAKAVSGDIYSEISLAVDMIRLAQSKDENKHNFSPEAREKTLASALKILDEQVKVNNPEAICLRATLWLEGVGCQKNVAEARSLVSQVCNLGINKPLSEPVKRSIYVLSDQIKKAEKTAPASKLKSNVFAG